MQIISINFSIKKTLIILYHWQKSSRFDLECHFFTFRCSSDEWFICAGQTRLSTGIRCMACQIWKMTKGMVAERKPSDKNMTTIYSKKHEGLIPNKCFSLSTPPLHCLIHFNTHDVFNTQSVFANVFLQWQSLFSENKQLIMDIGKLLSSVLKLNSLVLRELIEN